MTASREETARARHVFFFLGRSLMPSLRREYGADEIVSTKINWQQFVGDESSLTELFNISADFN
jgi:hypothetical protein